MKPENEGKIKYGVRGHMVNYGYLLDKKIFERKRRLDGRQGKER